MPGRKKYAPPRTVMKRGMAWTRAGHMPSRGMENGLPAAPSSGSLSSGKPLNLPLITQAFCTNSNCREMLAFKQRK